MVINKYKIDSLILLISIVEPKMSAIFNSLCFLNKHVRRKDNLHANTFMSISVRQIFKLQIKINNIYMILVFLLAAPKILLPF